MLILIVDTAGSEGAVLLARNESPSFDPVQTNLLGVKTLPPREFSREFISAAASLLEERKLILAELDAFAVISGPGSFTGLRVGLSAVKALAEVTSKPIIALSRLAILASAAEIYCSSLPPEAAVHAVLDAGRGEFYHGIYRDAGSICVDESLATLSTLKASLESFPGIIATPETIVSERLKMDLSQPLCLIPSLSVREALPLVLAAWREQRFTNVVELDANYVRRMVPKIC